VLTTDAYLFPLRPATQYYQARMLPVPGASEFSAPNPEYGALMTYYLKSDPPKESGTASSNGSSNGDASSTANAKTVKITVLAPDGSVVRELQGPDRQGLNRVSWDLRYPLTFKPVEGDEGWFGRPKGTFVLPGEYTIKLTARGQDLTQKVRVGVDPRSRTTPEALDARFKASQAVAELQRAFTESSDVVAAVSKDLDEVNATIKGRTDVPADVTSEVKAFSKKLDDLKEKFKGGWGGARFSIFDLAGQLQASASAPTEAQMRSLDQIGTRLTSHIAELNAFTSTDVPAFHDKLRAAGIATAGVKPVAPPKKQ
jgi:hypothetical protein